MYLGCGKQAMRNKTVPSRYSIHSNLTEYPTLGHQMTCYALLRCRPLDLLNDCIQRSREPYSQLFERQGWSASLRLADP